MAEFWLTSFSRKIAIIGSGAAGMAALWALHQHSPHQVYLYEAAPRLGGHINTVEFKKGEDGVNVDTGFIVLNNSTYREFPLFYSRPSLTEQPTS